MIFRDVTNVLNERKHLKIVFRSGPDAVILFLDRSNRPGLTALHRALQFEIEAPWDMFQKLIESAALYNKFDPVESNKRCKNLFP
jgi:hypothetical protein